MKNIEGFFEGRELKKLFYQYWLPDGEEIKAYIIALHGWGTHSDRLKLPAEYLKKEGNLLLFSVLAVHHRIFQSHNS